MSRVRINSARATVDQFNDINSFSLGDMSVQCTHCGAYRWSAEKSSLCCHNGRCSTYVHHPSIHPDLGHLFLGASDQSTNFLRKVRRYNQSFSFTSIRSRIDTNLASDRDGVYTFRVNGELCHRIGQLVPGENTEPSFCQIYFMDPDIQTDRRLGIFSELDFDTTDAIHQVMQRDNELAHQFQAARSAASEALNVRLVIKGAIPQGEHSRRYNSPSAPEIAAVVLDDEQHAPRDIVLYKHDGRLIKINEHHPAYDSLAYPLFFPEGRHGWSIEFKQATGITLKSYVQYRLMRRDEPNLLHLGGKLFQQFVVDQYLRVERQNMAYIRHNQRQLRAECYQGLVDAIQDQDRDGRIGRRIVLPSTVVGSPRFMQQRYQDSMAIVRAKGKPDLFITMTCNPRWPEIAEQLLEHQTAQDRPDLCARVFHAKFHALLDELVKKKVLGVVTAHCYTIEFQKRGLPHAHLLAWLEDKPIDGDDVDQILCAEIPDLVTQPRLYAAVSANMMHGPCGNDNPSCPCMKDGTCSKNFPKSFRSATDSGHEGRMLYRRRDTGRIVQKVVRGRQIVLDNRHVVPYNPYLVGKYNCHINVEVCSSTTSVKYLHKYVYKGPDRGVLEGGDDIDEIQQYLEGRYIAAQEACWRLFGFETHGISHVVMRLPVHLPGQQNVVFNSDGDIAEAVSRNEKTMLTEFFAANRKIREEIERSGRDPRHPNHTRLLTYPEFPLRHAWVKQRKEWVPRKNARKVIARATMVPPTTDLFYLRMLLNHVVAPVSFEDVRTVRGEVHPTFKSAAIARGLLQDDTEWHNCMQEGALVSSPSHLRRLFATLLVFGELSDPAGVLYRHIDAMSEDQHHARPAQQRQFVLSALNYCLAPYNKDLSTFLNTSDFYIDDDDDDDRGPNFPDDNNDLDVPWQETEVVPPLNDEQRVVFDTVTRAVREQTENRLFFLDGPGGTGKTFVYNALLKSLRETGHRCLAMATSGIAACLLEQGRTAHSSLAIPLQVHEGSTCNISARSEKADELRQIDLILWDEAPMAKRLAIEAVDRTLQDIMGDERPFGGKVILFGGDFRQILPVVLAGGRQQTVNACLKKSPIWSSLTQLTLKKNMRLQTHPEFQQYLLNVGEGRSGNQVIIPPSMVCRSNTLDALIDATFSDLSDCANCVILATRNDDCNRINGKVLERMPGATQVCLSADTVADTGDQYGQYPVEFLNTLQPSGLPPHCLEMKQGQIIMLLRNLNPSRGLCNGTRLRLLNVSQAVLFCELVDGQHKGSKVLIPRITHSSTDPRLPFVLSRRQFPVTGAFAVTINKSQGQSFDRVGVYLSHKAFTHGQLYVALSRARYPDRIQVSDDAGTESICTDNIVFREVFSQ